MGYKGQVKVHYEDHQGWGPGVVQGGLTLSHHFTDNLLS